MSLRHLGCAVRRMPLLLAALLCLSLSHAADLPDKPIAAALQPFVDAHRLAGAVVLVAGRDRVLTCDLTKEYVAINGDYRS